MRGLAGVENTVLYRTKNLRKGWLDGLMAWYPTLDLSDCAFMYEQMDAARILYARAEL